MEESSSESQPKKNKLVKTDEYEASNYFCKMSKEEKDAALKELSEALNLENIDVKSHYKRFRKLQRNLFCDLSVVDQMRDFPWLKIVSFLLSLIGIITETQSKE